MITPKKQRELKAFHKIVKQSMDCVEVFQHTGKRNQFTAVMDQMESFQDEFGPQTKTETYLP